MGLPFLKLCFQYEGNVEMQSTNLCFPGQLGFVQTPKVQYNLLNLILINLIQPSEEHYMHPLLVEVIW